MRWTVSRARPLDPARIKGDEAGRVKAVCNTVVVMPYGLMAIPELMGSMNIEEV
jgi:hypothetical protein